MTDKHDRLLQSRARTLRCNATLAERRLWTMLSGSKIGGLKFRRQAVIGTYIADFLCPALALVIEADGDSHDDPARDIRRDPHLHDVGYTVLRFANWQVLEQGDMVASAILETSGQLKARWENGPRNQRLDFPTPDPSPEGEGS